MITSELLQGGITNRVSVALKDGTLTFVKAYANDELIGIPSKRRLQRETLALQHFGRTAPSLTPRLIAVDKDSLAIQTELLQNTHLLDEHLHTVSPSERERIFSQAGSILRHVHTPVRSDPLTHAERYIDKTFASAQKAHDILQHVGLNGVFLANLTDALMDREAINRAGITRVHRDVWMNNFLYDGENITGLIDWEHAGIGSPYEDFAIFNLWVERVHDGTEAFWRGYGARPDEKTLRGYVLGKCIQFLGLATLEQYEEQERKGGGFLTKKTDMIATILQEITQ